MGFEWGGMEKTPEAELARRETRQRGRKSSVELAHTYTASADALLSGESSIAVKDELSRFARKLLSAREGFEQGEYVKQLLNSLRLRKIEIPDWMDSDKDRTAFAIALSRRYEQSLQ